MPATRQELFDLFARLGISTTTAEHPPVFTVEEAKKVHDDIPGGTARTSSARTKRAPSG